MFTNRLFNLIVAAVIVILAIQFTGIAASPAAAPITHTTAGNYEDRYDGMNDIPDADSLHRASIYSDRYDHMNAFAGADSAYNVGKYEDRYDRMNPSLDADPWQTAGKHEDRYDFMNHFPGTDR